jgi:hypothetical protein
MYYHVEWDTLSAADPLDSYKSKVSLLIDPCFPGKATDSGGLWFLTGTGNKFFRISHPMIEFNRKEVVCKMYY